MITIVKIYKNISKTIFTVKVLSKGRVYEYRFYLIIIKMGNRIDTPFKVGDILYL